MDPKNLAHRRRQNFENSKIQCLSKRDKSFAGRIDARAVDICGVINDREEFYTTSSCSGRCFLYRGSGIKATDSFRRWRISHDKIKESQRYFDLSTLESDPTGGADPIRSVGQFEHAEKVRQIDGDQDQPKALDGRKRDALEQDSQDYLVVGNQGEAAGEDEINPPMYTADAMLWLRFEPFILHVACRSLAAASSLMNAARPAFKNVGLTTWKDEQSTNAGSNFSKYLVAIWGDEGLDMPLCTPDGTQVFANAHDWLAGLVNERHQRNWMKIERFVQAVRAMPSGVDDEYVDDTYHCLGDDNNENGAARVPKSFDVLGDVAVLNTLPPGDQEELSRIGDAIMTKNKAIKIVVARQANLDGTERAPGASGFVQLAGEHQRNPLMTSHAEYNIKCVIDLSNTFFSPRMGPERLRICQQVARGEHVLVLFAGVGMEALQIAGRTEASKVVAVELNPIAVQCLRRSHQLLARNRAVKCVGGADRLEIIEGDVLKVIPERFEPNYFDRVLAPRPKEGSADGDLGTGDGGVDFLRAMLPVMKQDGGEAHWYDFAADHEFPQCERTRQLLERTCASVGLDMQVLHVANAGSVAMRQLRVCVDFRISPKPH
ncbi:synthesizing protein 3 homolog [Seminavis robusta]|uniref:Synthesizing protein 3 homolog n=1 Tax=Seminavis robusta TaxID=568900 RepID=A0A9N8HD51_9STRA|nr:synthesizing protein 3 homolog [Seminavis robusta]|eukprot:Sro246_g097660.1 synthesizing protein 3 homolog (603) ;mRNA; f:32693-34663